MRKNLYIKYIFRNHVSNTLPEIQQMTYNIYKSHKSDSTKNNFLIKTVTKPDGKRIQDSINKHIMK